MEAQRTTRRSALRSIPSGSETNNARTTRKSSRISKQGNVDEGVFKKPFPVGQTGAPPINKEPLQPLNETTTPRKSTSTGKENLPVPSKKNKKQCASPPSILKDKKATTAFTKGQLLGEGGFARVYAVWDASGKRYAAKTISKSALKSPKAKAKLFTEIKIHQNMDHVNIVKFHHVFEDAQNVYIILELCENRTFVELLKRRKRLSEDEARPLLKQILEAVRYMHGVNVIHRDLKLGNLFFDGDMNVKVGDFGLATQLMSGDERRKTICGTPNYLAPEILFDRKKGHSFEVDVWSFGVILYSTLIGRPPFQTKDVQEIYRRIKNAEYSFPSSVVLSNQVKNLIKSILTTVPEDRPRVEDLIAHPWFSDTGSADIIDLAKDTTVITETAIPLPSKHKNPKPKEDAKENQKATAPDAAIKTGMEKLSLTDMVNSKVSTDSAIKKHPDVPLTKMALSSKLKPSSVVHFSPQIASKARRSTMETIYQNLQAGLTQARNGLISESLRAPADKVVEPKVFLSKWIDYSNKYGLGYQLTNGCVGVYFNDSTSIVLSASETNFEYLEYARGSERTTMNRQSHTLSKYPDSLKKKVTLLNYFKNYMEENLSKTARFCFKDVEKTSNMDFVVKYLRTKHAVLFRLTNHVVQINFFDHSKLLISHLGLVLTYIDRDKNLQTMSTHDALTQEKTDIINRIKYTRDILENMTVKKSTTTNDPTATPKK